MEEDEGEMDGGDDNFGIEVFCGFMTGLDVDSIPLEFGGGFGDVSPIASTGRGDLDHIYAKLRGPNSTIDRPGEQMQNLLTTSDSHNHHGLLFHPPISQIYHQQIDSIQYLVTSKPIIREARIKAGLGLPR